MSLQVQVLFGRMAPLEALQVQAREIDSLLLEEIAARRSSPGEDICSLLVQARFEDGTGMGDGEIRDQLMTLLMAGHETTATGLAWTLDLLVRHPDVLERARTGDETYLKAVVSESLRLRPVVPLAGRRLAVPLEVDGLSLPVGTDVTPAMWLTHTRPEEYPEPYAFRPERFLENPPSTYTWIPFGGGVRRCIGAPFAELEMRVVLGEVLERFDLRPAGRGAEGIARRNVTFSPRHGTRVDRHATMKQETDCQRANFVSRCVAPSRAAVLAVATLFSESDSASAASPRVAALQVALRHHGMYSGTVDGLSGPGTAAAVRRFQARRGLSADGVVGPRTRRAFGTLGRHPIGSRPLRSGMSGWDVAALQFALAAKGFPGGPVDGGFGARTDSAVRRVQAYAGLRADGVAGPATMAVLRRPGPATPALAHADRRADR